ncbi:DNA repair protein RecN [bacterium MnTg02]|nr:DNA repair protein RecN [bacterium MnTg02]
MLLALSIRDIVLIKSLDLTFNTGLTALTGETGAGKSILLDAFALALGARGDGSLVRSGVAQGQVTAVFDVADTHPAHDILKACGIETESTLIARRSQSADGRTRAYINDQPVTVQLLRRVGAALVEIHGQHDDRAFVDSRTHRDLLDAYGGLSQETKIVARAWENWKAAEKALKAHEEQIAKIRQDADYVRHALGELSELAPQPGEEAALAGRRQIMMNAEKIADDLQGVLDAVNGDKSGIAALSAAARRLERQASQTPEMIEPVAAALERALTGLSDARDVVEDAMRQTAFEPCELEAAEERLFELRAAARKHQVPADKLPELRAHFEQELDRLVTGEDQLEELRQTVNDAAEAYKSAALILSKRRQRAAKKLDAAIMKELGPLKLERAKFITEVHPLEPAQGGPSGMDQVSFHVQTNPGTAPGPLMKVASGGELSRFILALKVVLAARGSTPTLIFDEIDTGLGGATASAIGERLHRLGENVQVLSITHAPQVAAAADRHLRISKEPAAGSNGETMVTQVIALDSDHRREEIARMLAGATVTDEARAAAKRLIGGSV